MTRLYLTQTLKAGQIIELSKDQRHYLEKVLRFKSGEYFLGFNEKNGEWKIIFEKPDYKCINQTRESLTTQTCWLAFSPLKHDAMNFLIEKATELGVTDFQPIICERTNSHRINIERLTKNVIEASQQCERFDVPRIHEAIDLKKFLKELPTDIDWYAAVERSDVEHVKFVFPAGFIIGPEGGWSAEEQLILKKFSKPISLGANILRAETAAVVCLGAKIFQK
ncbi:MAG: 16S rRNA (uracil(1498)-N(3))-methyltransferase [Proteobacteria bacterium]|nr:16S rRNA (uracil(1498)-N(3))-methyltransferase [Pseudomonadota bacterium]